MAQQLSIFKIKDKYFDYDEYGLEDVYFALDMSRSIQHSKNTNTTDYALLDGTTRIDTVSKAPGTINFQGKIGELNYSTNPAMNIKQHQDRNRLQNQMYLLESLRDQAVLLDIITAEKVYKDYLLTTINFGKTNLGTIDVNLTFKEIILFGDEIDIFSNKDSYTFDDTVISHNLENLTVNEVNSDIELINEVYRLVTESEIVNDYIIRLGNAETYPDLVIPPIEYERGSIRSNFTPNAFEYIYKSPKITKDYDAKEYISGLVRGNYYLHISIKDIARGILTSTLKGNVISYPLDSPSIVEPVFKDVGMNEIKIQLIKKNIRGDDKVEYVINTKDLIIPPKYSEKAPNGINPVVDDGGSYNYINNNGMLKGYKAGTGFINKNRYGVYTTTTNLLRSAEMGYLYPAFYESSVGNKNYINLGFVYIHPKALPFIKEKLTEVLEKSPYFKNKTFRWWN